MSNLEQTNTVTTEVHTPHPQPILTSDEALRNILDRSLDDKLKRLDITDQKLDKIVDKVAFLEEKCISLENDQITQHMSMTKLREENEHLKSKLVQLECYSRRDNLIFYGIPEKRQEHAEATILQILHKANVDLEARAFTRAHRLGKFDKFRTRPIIVRFHHFRDKTYVLKSTSEIRRCCEFPIRITEDYPQEILTQRKILLPIFHAAKKQVPPNTRVQLIINQLHIGSKSFDVDNLDKLPPELSPHNIASPSTDNTVAFFTQNSAFSNHHKCSFMVDGVVYSSGEQWLMAKKALLFNDKAKAKQIMTESDPVKIKGHGKNIIGFDPKIWREEAPKIMKIGLEAKFGQNDDLAAKLISTGDKQIIEASEDEFWGVGLTLWSEHLFDPDHWSGLNILGQILMSVREQLK